MLLFSDKRRKIYKETEILEGYLIIYRDYKNYSSGFEGNLLCQIC